ncbi:ChbG/HpnK family deacetylase [Mitsuokella multacida]|uniref:ChbG/HpnK family deacetylase n=1 Tax=Mitsuokella multacida TaxID=52226 RepID=UPI001F3B2333|nr:ChbG/HpnK family deacetylase [Mitsuokella multacida]MCF2583618.1 ChbG/HpnK family deacetylase [Mitsuokella multacida]
MPSISCIKKEEVPVLRYIIINADDFGRHAEINRAVEEGLVHGCLRSATVMPGGAAFAGAIDIARRHEELGLGVHFTLVDGHPILPPEEIPSLVGSEGDFLPDHTALLKRYLKGGVNLEEVRRELAAQLQKIEATGIPISHVDSHQHMHTLPGIIDIVLDLAARAGIRAVRTPRTPLFAGAFGGLGQLVGRLGLSTLARLAACKAHRRGLLTPDNFAGIVAGEAVSEGELLHLIAHLPQGTTEVMMHPGMKNDVLQEDSGWQHDFEAELAAILSPRVGEALRKAEVEPVNFRHLSCTAEQREN